MSHGDALEAIERILAGDGDVLQPVVDVLHDDFENYSWVGIYLVEGDDLVLGPWKGPEATEHVRIPVGQGICGAAAATGRDGDRGRRERRPALPRLLSLDPLGDRRADRPRRASRRRDRHRLRPPGRVRRPTTAPSSSESRC